MINVEYEDIYEFIIAILEKLLIVCGTGKLTPFRPWFVFLELYIYLLINNCEDGSNDLWAQDRDFVFFKEIFLKM